MKKILIVMALMLLWVSSASAGVLVVHDRAAFLTQADVSSLESTARSMPFDVHVLTENVSKAQLGDDAHKAVTGPSVVAIGIDPAAHNVAERFGASTGVKQADFDSIAASGNPFFKSNERRAGIVAMLERARASSQAREALVQSSTPVVMQEGLGFGAWCAILIGVSMLAGLAYWLFKKAREDRQSYERALQENQLQTSDLLSRNVEEMTRPAPALRPRGSYEDFVGTLNASPRRAMPVIAPSVPTPYYAPQPVYVAPQPVYHDHGSDLLTGVLIGEALARPSPRYVERDVVIERTVDSGGSSSSWSGSDSSYGSGSSSSSSDDSGGSSASWGSSDSGGSSDYGGGSSDSGSSGGGDSSW